MLKEVDAVLIVLLLVAVAIGAILSALMFSGVPVFLIGGATLAALVPAIWFLNSRYRLPGALTEAEQYLRNLSSNPKFLTQVDLAKTALFEQTIKEMRDVYRVEGAAVRVANRALQNLRTIKGVTNSAIAKSPQPLELVYAAEAHLFESVPSAKETVGGAFEVLPYLSRQARRFVGEVVASAVDKVKTSIASWKQTGEMTFLPVRTGPREIAPKTADNLKDFEALMARLVGAILASRNRPNAST